MRMTPRLGRVVFEVLSGGSRVKFHWFNPFRFGGFALGILNRESCFPISLLLLGCRPTRYIIWPPRPRRLAHCTGRSYTKPFTTWFKKGLHNLLRHSKVMPFSRWRNLVWRLNNLLQDVWNITKQKGRMPSTSRVVLAYNTYLSIELM